MISKKSQTILVLNHSGFNQDGQRFVFVDMFRTTISDERPFTSSIQVQKNFKDSIIYHSEQISFSLTQTVN